MIRRSTLIVLGALIVLVAVAFFVQRSNDDQELQVTPTESSPLLFSFDSQIMSLRLEQVGGGVVDIGRDAEGLWQLNWPKAEATDIGEVESAVSQLLSLRIVTSLIDGPSLEDAGLKPPSYNLLLTFQDGSQERMSVGKLTPTESGYYVQVGNRGLFVINKYSLDPFLKLVEDPPIQPTPTMEVDALGTPIPGTTAVPTLAP